MSGDFSQADMSGGKTWIQGEIRANPKTLK
jgi:hypothetical protein